jgi:hypothetical protein
MEISFPDGSHKRIASDGAEDITFPDGTRVQVSREKKLDCADTCMSARASAAQRFAGAGFFLSFLLWLLLGKIK